MTSSIGERVKIGAGTRMIAPVNVYDCTIGINCMIGPFTEIQRGVTIGNGVKVESHSFLCTGLTVKDGVFIGHGVMFINDHYPDAADQPHDQDYAKTVVCRGISIGSGAVILPVVIGEGAVVGAGAVVTKDVLPWSVVAGNPARILRMLTPEPANDPVC